MNPITRYVLEDAYNKSHFWLPPEVPDNVREAFKHAQELFRQFLLENAK